LTFGYVTIIRIKVILTINRMTIIIKTEITKIVLCHHCFFSFSIPKFLQSRMFQCLCLSRSEWILYKRKNDLLDGKKLVTWHLVVTIIRIKVIVTINRMTVIIKTEMMKIVLCHYCSFSFQSQNFSNRWRVFVFV
jgi:hypothetical protein